MIFFSVVFICLSVVFDNSIELSTARKDNEYFNKNCVLFSQTARNTL